MLNYRNCLSLCSIIFFLFFFFSRTKCSVISRRGVMRNCATRRSLPSVHCTQPKASMSQCCNHLPSQSPRWEVVFPYSTSCWKGSLQSHRDHSTLNACICMFVHKHHTAGNMSHITVALIHYIQLCDLSWCETDVYSPTKQKKK